MVETFRWLYLIIGACGTILLVLCSRLAFQRNAISGWCRITPSRLIFC
jgi:hypothetical protein